MDQQQYKLDALRWRQQARADLAAAGHSRDAGHFEWACFQSQQAAEKAMKSLWYHYAVEPWGHSVAKLVDEFPIAALKPRVAILLDSGRKLDKLYIPTRYPNGLPDLIPASVYTRAEAEEAIAEAERIIRTVETIITD